MIFGGLFDFDKKEEEIKKLEEITKESNFWDDVSLANKEGIKKLGAKGIVEIDNQLKIVFDADAVKLKKCIEELLKQKVKI